MNLSKILKGTRSDWNICHEIDLDILKFAPSVKMTMQLSEVLYPWISVSDV